MIVQPDSPQAPDEPRDAYHLVCEGGKWAVTP